MLMKFNEVRPYNRIAYCGVYSVVIDCNLIGFRINHNGFTVWIDENNLSAKGIPLEAELLSTQLGFNEDDKDSTDLTKQIPDTQMWLRFDALNNLMYLDVYGKGQTSLIGTPLPTKYVHELQNLYFDLSGGKELL